jgi:hypothetical protein
VRRPGVGRRGEGADHAVADVMSQCVSQVVAEGRDGLRLGASMRCVHASVYWGRSSSGWQSPWPLECRFEVSNGGYATVVMTIQCWLNGVRRVDVLGAWHSSLKTR